MGRASFREKIIEAGLVEFYQQGYNASGVRDISEAAGVPLGSFTNHFRSKEAFALEVLDRYFAELQSTMEATLLDEARPPLDRLDAYFDTIEGILASSGWRYGCMVTNMALEVPEHSELIRARLVEIFAGLTEPFASAVRAAQAEGDVRCDRDAEDLAAFLLSGWHGALLRMKVERSSDAIKRFRRVLAAVLSDGWSQGTG